MNFPPPVDQPSLFSDQQVPMRDEQTLAAELEKTKIENFPYHNPFDVNSYPITNPPLFDSTMMVPYTTADGVPRRRRISISNGQIGQIINHEAFSKMRRMRSFPWSWTVDRRVRLMMLYNHCLVQHNQRDKCCSKRSCQL